MVDVVNPRHRPPLPGRQDYKAVAAWWTLITGGAPAGMEDVRAIHRDDKQWPVKQLLRSCQGQAQRFLGRRKADDNRGSFGIESRKAAIPSFGDVSTTSLYRAPACEAHARSCGSAERPSDSTKMIVSG